MVVFDEQKIELLISQCRFSEAAANLVVSQAQDVRAERQRKRFLRSVYAMTSNDRALGSLVDPVLLSLGSVSEIASYHDAMTGGATFQDQLVAGVVLTWSSDSHGAYRLFRTAHERASEEHRPSFAAAALERLAQHAVLFGDIELARTTYDELIRFASEHSLTQWLLRCVASAARLAIDTDDLESAEQLLEYARATSPPDSAATLFAPIDVHIALEKGHDTLARDLISREIIDAALYCSAPETAISATLAVAIAGDGVDAQLPIVPALRRAIFQAQADAAGVELLAMAAKYGDITAARFGARALAAVPAPNRPYLKAHRMLARAQVFARRGNYAASVDCASDAARAFNALGVRRWTNEAMLLLVRAERSYLRRGNGSVLERLTERERQVADLIRRGASNREVADTLTISEHTVERHVSSILGRLGLRSRWQIPDAFDKRKD
jgi:DNA-binding CsgD family transcriptional regulator